MDFMEAYKYQELPSVNNYLDENDFEVDEDCQFEDDNE